VKTGITPEDFIKNLRRGREARKNQVRLQGGATDIGGGCPRTKGPRGNGGKGICFFLARPSQGSCWSLEKPRGGGTPTARASGDWGEMSEKKREELGKFTKKRTGAGKRGYRSVA